MVFLWSWKKKHFFTGVLLSSCSLRQYFYRKSCSIFFLFLKGNDFTKVSRIIVWKFNSTTTNTLMFNKVEAKPRKSLIFGTTLLTYLFLLRAVGKPIPQFLCVLQHCHNVVLSCYCTSIRKKEGLVGHTYLH